MTPEGKEGMGKLFNIEGFFRTRSNYEATLKLDEMILRDDISDVEKIAHVNQLIAETVKAVQEGVTKHER